jgi:hypothetical protein
MEPIDNHVEIIQSIRLWQTVSQWTSSLCTTVVTHNDCLMQLMHGIKFKTVTMSDLKFSQPSTLNRKAICPFKISINFYQTPWHHIPEDSLDTGFSKFQLSTVSITIPNSWRNIFILQIFAFQNFSKQTLDDAATQYLPLQNGYKEQNLILSVENWQCMYIHVFILSHQSFLSHNILALLLNYLRSKEIQYRKVPDLTLSFICLKFSIVFTVLKFTAGLKWYMSRTKCINIFFKHLGRTLKPCENVMQLKTWLQGQTPLNWVFYITDDICGIFIFTYVSLLITSEANYEFYKTVWIL